MTKPTTARTCIVEAFLQLCQTLPCDKITVSQLTKKAGYNRSTFYAYFNNTDDLLKQLENELFQLVDTFLPHGLRIFRTGMPTAEERLLSQRFFMLVRAIFTVPGIYLPLGQRYYMVMKERGEDK